MIFLSRASWRKDGNNFLKSRAAVSALRQGLPTLPPGRPEVSKRNLRQETFGQADGGVWRPAPSAIPLTGRFALPQSCKGIQGMSVSVTPGSGRKTNDAPQQG